MMQPTPPQGLKRKGSVRPRFRARPDSSCRDHVREALDWLRAPLFDFLSSRMRSKYGDLWVEYALGGLHTSPALSRTTRGDLRTDLSAMLNTVARFWHVAFGPGSGRFTRIYFDELREYRNALAHGETISPADAFRAVDTVHRLLAVLGQRDRTDSGRLRALLLQRLGVAVETTAREHVTRHGDAPVPQAPIEATARRSVTGYMANETTAPRAALPR